MKNITMDDLIQKAGHINSYRYVIDGNTINKEDFDKGVAQLEKMIRSYRNAPHIQSITATVVDRSGDVHGMSLTLESSELMEVNSGDSVCVEALGKTKD